MAELTGHPRLTVSYLRYGFDIAFINANTGIAGGSEGKIGRTTDGGVTWDSIGSPQYNWSYYKIQAFSVNELYLVGDPRFSL